MATLEQIKELRTRTGGGIVECKEALEEAGGDIEAAIAILRKKGLVKAAKKADRATQEGTIATYLHTNGKVGVIVSVLCETDFVARNERFQELAHNIALHIAAADPIVVSPDDVPAEAVAAEEEVAKEQAQAADKPAEIQAKIIEGKLKSFREERALLTQPYVKDPSQTITDLINEAIQELGENISVGQFSRITI